MTSKYHVLVVDDARDTRRLLCTGIASLGERYSVSGFPSAEEALLELGHTHSHLLVTDVRLTGISGLDLLKKVRIRFEDLKVIVITGLNDMDLRRRALEAGADAFFTQPVDMDDFLARVSSLVDAAVVDEGVKAPVNPAVDETGASLRTALGGHLERFMHTFDTQAALLLDTNGEICLSAGDRTVFPVDSSLPGALLQAARAAEAVFHVGSHEIGRSLQVVYGDERTLLCSLLTDGYAILLALPSDGRPKMVPDLLAGVRTLIDELNGLDLTRLDSNEALPSPTPDVEFEASPQNLDELSDVEPDSDLEAIFTRAAQLSFLSGDVDRYWETLVADSEDGSHSRDGVISYEKAREMGLAPEGDDDQANIS